MSALDRAMAMHRAGKLDQALSAYQDLIAADPQNADALHLTGLLAHQMGRTSVGIACIEHALTINPAAPLFHRNMAELRKSSGDPARAIHHLEQSLALNPLDAGACGDLGLMQAACGEYEAAVESYRKALKLDPKLAGTETNLGVALEELGDETGAQAAYERALQLNPGFAPALNNLGALLGAQEQVEAGITLLRQAIAAEPDHVEARVNLGHLLLVCGQTLEGWTMLEARRAVARAMHPPQGVRAWDGAGDPCRRLLVCAEQGLGDELMFAACLAALQAAQPRSKLIIECDPRLAPLFTRSFPNCEIRPYRITQQNLRSNKRDWLLHAPVDAYVPAGTLPLHFLAEPGSSVNAAGYLSADRARVAHWQDWIASLPGRADRLAVGLCWRSGRGGGTRDATAIALPHWAPLLRSERLLIVNLQYGAGAPALADHAATIGAQVATPPALDQFNDLDDVAALITALDHVVSAPTSVCEMAGALGSRTWRLVRGNDWSLLGASSRRPWHPNTQVIHSSRYGDPAELVNTLLTNILAV